jgi:hypothetical protein
MAASRHRGIEETNMAQRIIKAIGAAALLASAAASAQPATPATPDQQAPVASNVVPERANGPGLGRRGNGRLQPPVLVDANGELVGRYIGGTALLAYAGEAMAIPLAWDTIDAQTQSGYFTWNGFAIVFTTPDCSGKAYGYPNYMTFGTRYVGQGVYDGNAKSWFAYVFDHNNMQVVTIGSMLQYDQWAKTMNCYASSGTMLYMPAIDTIALDAIARMPLKVE